MKKIIAMILALSVVLAFMACAKEEPIQTGKKLDDVHFFEGERENYKEKKISKYKKEFSFSMCDGKYEWEGVLSGEDIVEVTWTMPVAKGTSYSDFNSVLTGIKNGQMPRSENEGAITNVVLTTVLAEMVFFKNDSITMGELVDMICHGKEIKNVDWKATGKLDSVKGIVTISITYQN